LYASEKDKNIHLDNDIIELSKEEKVSQLLNRIKKE